MGFPKRGEIWLAKLDPTIGSEINKTRPVCIISNNINNEFSPILTVVPITDVGRKVYPFEIELKAHQAGMKKDSKIQCQQIRSIDKQRVFNKLADLSADKIRSLERALAVHLGIYFKG